MIDERPVVIIRRKYTVEVVTGVSFGLVSSGIVYGATTANPFQWKPNRPDAYDKSLVCINLTEI